MNKPLRLQPTRRTLIGLAVLWLWAAGCAAGSGTQVADPQRRFRGVGVVLVVDAIPDAEMKGVTFFSDVGYEFYGKSTVAKRNREILALGGTRVPLTARVVWRDRPKPVWGKHGGIDYEGPITGDYTIPVGQRIPDAVLDDIRAHGGALRLKFRLKPDGVLFGWDIERAAGSTSRFDLPGGDFLDTRY